MNSVTSKLAPLLRQWHGPLTQELVLHPGEFGLGKIPARLQPDATTTMVCGFCSTGCGLTVHLRDGQRMLSRPARYIQPAEPVYHVQPPRPAWAGWAYTSPARTYGSAR